MTPDEGRGQIDTRDLRRAFGRFGTGVTVITALAPNGQRLGVTASSFNTVSLEPPIVLWSLSANSASLQGFRDAGGFVVNVLSLRQINLSRRFSSPIEDKFDSVEYSAGLAGMPVLSGCAATLECTVFGEHVVGDHVLFLGKVERYAHDETNTLLFCNGTYMQAVDIDLSVRSNNKS
ncbi:MAG: flavin reductase family protein [Steroidobacteraceae bacterium]